MIDLSNVRPTEAFVVPEAANCIDFVHPETGRSCINDQTLEQIRERNPGAIKVNLDEWIQAVFEKANPPLTWLDSTEEKFDEMLGALPPRRFVPGAFLVGEPVDHLGEDGAGRYECHRCQGDKFQVSSRPITVKEFNALFS
jgi:hypothetical protein